jgi:hypothetical protein
MYGALNQTRCEIILQLGNVLTRVLYTCILHFSILVSDNMLRRSWPILFLISFFYALQFGNERRHGGERELRQKSDAFQHIRCAQYVQVI